MNKSLLACALALASIGTAYAGGPANFIVPVNMDPAGSGLNDTTPATPVGGNPGVTIGQQRVLAYQLGADLWNNVLDSANNTTVNVEASFQALTCTATSAVLGSAGAKTIHANFTNGMPSTWYGNALANALSGADVSPGTNEIASRFNSNLGQPNCLAGSGWYYGFDGNTPAGQISFLDVVMHEIGHGLNFQGFYSSTTGAPAGTAPNDFPDIYSRNVRDNNSGLAYTAMTNSQRLTALVGDNLVWTGTNVTAQAPTELGPQVNLFLQGPRVGKDYAMVPAAYGPPATPGSFTSGQIVRAFDASGADSQGCAAFPAGAFTGRTVLIDRGTCSFKTKTLNAQIAGAAKVIIANNVPSGFPGMGDDPVITTPITIPSIGITQGDGAAIKKMALAGVSGNLQTKPGQFAGTDTSGRVYLYAPNPVAGGSSFSHFDVRLTPNALMEPFINDSLNAAVELDLTPALFKDLGWSVAP